MFKYKLSSSNESAPEECFFLVLKKSRLLKLDNLLPTLVEDFCGGRGVLASEEGEITHLCTMSTFLLKEF